MPFLYSWTIVIYSNIVFPCLRSNYLSHFLTALKHIYKHNSLLVHLLTISQPSIRAYSVYFNHKTYLYLVFLASFLPHFGNFKAFFNVPRIWNLFQLKMTFSHDPQSWHIVGAAGKQSKQASLTSSDLFHLSTHRFPIVEV